MFKKCEMCLGEFRAHRERCACVLRRFSGFPCSTSATRATKPEVVICSFSSLARAACCALVLSLSLTAFAVDPAAIQPQRDILYKSGDALDEYEKERCKLDVYSPPNAQDLPCVVWFHGGGLTGGNKGGAIGPALAGEGMVVALVNYRLSPKATYPAYVDDAAAAVAWMLKHAREYGGNPRRVFVAGHSAGGYLTAMVALDSRLLAKYGAKPEELAGAIPVSGQMVTHYTVRVERGLPKTQIIVDEAAPIFHARKETPPLLVLYADKDMTLRADENRYFAAALAAVGNKNVTLLEITGHDHGTIGSGLTKAGDQGHDAFLAFVKEHGAVSAAP